MNEPIKKFRLQKKWVFIAACIIILVIIVVGWHLWKHYSYHVSTDDAYVEGRVSPVSAVVTGIVTNILVNDNQGVEKGQILIELDPKYYRSKFEQVKAAAAIAKSRLEAADEMVLYSRDITSSQVAQARAAHQASTSATRASRQVKDQVKAILESKKEALAISEAELEEKRALEEKARINFNHLRNLLGKKVISQVQFDMAKADLDASVALVSAAKRTVLQSRRELEAASAELKVKETGYAYSSAYLGVKSAKAMETEARAKVDEMVAKERSTRIKELERELAKAQLDEALANLKYAENNLEDTIIRASISGRVTKKSVEIGQVVRPGQPLMAIVSLSDIWIVANFKETQLTDVKPDQKVEITIDTYPDEVLTGRVDSIQAGTGARFSLFPPENASGNFVKVVQRIPVKITIDEIPDSIIVRPGMSVVPTIELQ